MKSTSRRSARPDPARRRLRSNLETLESRQLLSGTPYLASGNYPLSDFPVEQPPGPTPDISIPKPIGSDPKVLATYSNSGKVITGQDRQGNSYKLTLTGPGKIIVTDTTPNDGVLDDDIDTIRVVGTDPKKSSLHGQVSQSTRVPSDYTLLPTLGTVRFNQLVAQRSLKAIVLNGFILTDTITPPGSTSLSPAETSLNQTTGIQIKGTVGTLEFGGIDARFPASFNPVPITISIGEATTPNNVQPNIRIDRIYNTVYDDTAFSSGGSQTIPTGPLTSPTVTLIVNGGIKGLNVVSISQQPNLGSLYPPINNGFLNIPTQLIPTYSAALEYQFPIVGTTGRTAVQAKSINHLKVNGGTTNTTFSKAAQPFQNSLTGLDGVKAAQFGGPTDAIAIDSQGSIGTLKFAKGIGSTIGASSNPIYFGTPAAKYGYPAAGLLGGQIVTEGNIGSLVVAPSNQFLQTSQDPSQIQAGQNGYTTYVNRPGTAIQSSLILAQGSIGKTHIVGDIVNSEIRSGYDYYSGIAGADPVTGASSIGPLLIRGDLVDSVVAASYRSIDGIFGNGNDVAGNGTINGYLIGNVYQTTTGTTPLGNQGSGFYSKQTGSNSKK
ncbi:hypothetical protein P12x_001901 [Tundrisphaera lichenicola]|uniref:hypothetical protein n=1 Tax=Tundrisphaera lichenicola TaxID=2029860 RepID=UPI003EC103C3